VRWLNSKRVKIKTDDGELILGLTGRVVGCRSGLVWLRTDCVGYTVNGLRAKKFSGKARSQAQLALS